MITRQDFQAQLPPRAFMDMVMDTLSQVYCYLWDNRNAKNQVHLSWEELTRRYNRNSFRTSLRKLNNSGLLSYDESPDGILVELVGWDALSDE